MLKAYFLAIIDMASGKLLSVAALECLQHVRPPQQ